ncbi:MAG: PD40 domain-containing protein [Actinomycetia bacterium]|nr:PD40 domain-containing protein [Actinomycetes bacterium]
MIERLQQNRGWAVQFPVFAAIITTSSITWAIWRRRFRTDGPDPRIAPKARQLTHNQATDREPAWSPDGFLLAFTGDGDGDNEAFLVDADRRHPVQLTHNDYDDRDPTPGCRRGSDPTCRTASTRCGKISVRSGLGD